jgi:ferric-dicitrate binding protein FerR (iron transport regulator)
VGSDEVTGYQGVSFDESIQSPSDATLAEYLAGTLVAQERARVSAWVTADPRRAASLALLQGEIAGEAMIVVPPGLGATLRGSAPTPSPVRRWLRPAFVACAASIAAVVLARSTSWRSSTSEATAPGSITRYATRAGEQTTYRLPDGSAITLAPRTTIFVDVMYGTGSRTIRLDGEAYFDIAPGDARAPFAVRTAGVTTRVLGTTFQVRRYAAERETHVAVFTGRVDVFAQRSPTHHRSMVLVAGTRGVMNDSASGVAVRDSVKGNDWWASGTVKFQEAPVAEVLASLTRWYGYRFRIADRTLPERKLTAYLTMRSSARAFADLETLLGVDLTFNTDSTITLRPKASKQLRRPAGHQNGAKTSFPIYSEVGR